MSIRSIFLKENRHHRSSHNMATPFILLNKQKCKACWDCLEACPSEVLGRIAYWFHKHAIIVNPDKCKGCAKCVETCQNEALLKI